MDATDGRFLRMTIELPGVPVSTAIARRVVRAGLRATGEVSNVDDLELITSELVANAVSSTGHDITVTVTAEFGGSVLLEVSDDGPGWPYPRASEGEPPEIGGLGLHIVEELAAAWGCVPNIGRGKTIWVESPPPKDRPPTIP
jgi:anti-sigma regulatory factor (Ser/Thr protein kinase)